MFGLLHQYLVENKTLYLRGMGQLLLVQQPASFDVANQVLNAPRQTLQLQKGETGSSLQPLMAFISRQLDIAEENAFKLYEAFCSELQQDIEGGRHVHWKPLGTFQKDGNGNTTFVADAVSDAYNEAVPAKRIIRKDTAHNITVGTLETTNTAMRELLTMQAEEPRLKNRWWVGAVILGAIAVALIVLKKMQVI